MLCNSPNLVLTYIVDFGEKDAFGVPLYKTVPMAQVCKRNAVALGTCDRLCRDALRQNHPDHKGAYLVAVAWQKSDGSFRDAGADLSSGEQLTLGDLL